VGPNIQAHKHMGGPEELTETRLPNHKPIVNGSRHLACQPTTAASYTARPKVSQNDVIAPSEMVI
jgi:hypothetical protein